MTEKLADRTYRAALSMWEETRAGRKPERADFDHLDATPDAVPEFVEPASPEPPEQLATRAGAVDSVLAQMHEAARTKQRTPPTESS